ncbi:MAG: hypothetical protein DCE90_15085 [Pseudanabaena sp.]|nr:MAG: hypothetical protein DCE90_15085 [Pseudanabaena sp.]
MSQTELDLELTPTFSSNFLYKHAGRIIQRSDFAIIELVANCWDAGARNVKIQYPSHEDDLLVIEDDGIGMTEDEFKFRWNDINYERLKHQGREVVVSGDTQRKRTVFGKNGVGRHAVFCFTDEYYIETSNRNSPSLTKAIVTISKTDTSRSPFNIEIVSRSKDTTWHGTKIYGKVSRGFTDYNTEKIIDLISLKFIADPEFQITVNGRKVAFENLDSISERILVEDEEFTRDLSISRIDTQTVGRTTQQTGIAWWVNKRLVGKASWDGYEHSILDGRRASAKRYSYIVQANFLENFIQQDWSDFTDDQQVDKAKKVAYSAIEKDLSMLTKDEKKEKVKAALSANSGNVRKLPPMSKIQIVNFAEQVSDKCPSVKQGDLNSLIEILANLEKTRTGYSLLEKLAKCSIDDLSDLDDILGKWSVYDAKQVLDELRFRLLLIGELEKLVEVKTTDELHQLQPLFQKGLWMFGPKFESVEFTSNRSLLNVIKNLLDKKYQNVGLVSEPRRRPDFVVIPSQESIEGSSISLYCRDAYDSDNDNEVQGLEEIIIIELKRGGFEISKKEKRQAEDYAKELLDSGKVNDSTKIICYVLGSKIRKNEHHSSIEGNITVYPETYQTVLSKAHARTFRLYKKLQSFEENDHSLADENSTDAEKLLRDSNNLSENSLLTEEMQWHTDLSS